MLIWKKRVYGEELSMIYGQAFRRATCMALPGQRHYAGSINRGHKRALCIRYPDVYSDCGGRRGRQDTDEDCLPSERGIRVKNHHSHRTHRPVRSADTEPSY